MNDPKKINPRLGAQFIARARSAAREGYATGSTTEQIVSALLNNRADWLPERWTLLNAIDRLIVGGEDWFHTMLAVNKRGWREVQDMHEDRLP